MQHSARDTAPRLVVVADDLTGAVETAALLVSPDSGAPSVILDASPEQINDARTAPGALAINGNIRHLSHEAAREHVTSILALLGEDVTLFVKVDSLLRGPIAAVTQALADRAPTLCTAVPATGRSVVDGVVHIAGVPLHETDAWRAEAKDVPASVAESLGEAANSVILRDAVTDVDLAEIAAGAPGVLVGAAGLARAWAARNTHHAIPIIANDPQRGRRELSAASRGRPDPLCLIGTASSEAAAQVALCERVGIPVLRPSADELVTAVPPKGVPAVVVAPTESADPAVVKTGFISLAERTAEDRDLILSGGATASAVLAAVGITSLIPVAEVYPGAVVSRAQGPGAADRLVITRPGSYGDATGLQAAMAALVESSQELV